MRCVLIPGNGRPRIRTDITIRNKFGTGETKNETGVGMLFRQFGQYFKGQNACLGESQSAGCGDYCIIIGWTG